MREMQCKRPGCNVKFRPKSPAAKYCGDVCRTIMKQEYHKKYAEKYTGPKDKPIKFLTQEERQEKFKIGLEFVRGTVIHRHTERRAVKVNSRIGDPVVYISTEDDGLINVRAGRVTSETFEEITE